MKLVKGIGANYKNRPSTGTKSYATWHSILEDCVDPKSKSSLGDFQNYQVFYDWHVSQTGFPLDYRVAKNLLDKNNTVYQSNKCVLVPIEVSAFLRNAKKSRSDLPIGVDHLKLNVSRPYIARLSIDKVRTTLGTHSTIEGAFQAYKVAKEAEAKRLAEKYKGKMSERAYNALINYTVEITD